MSYSSVDSASLYDPSQIAGVARVYPNGNVDLTLRIYLPKTYGPGAPTVRDDTATWSVQVKVGSQDWQDLKAPDREGACWTLTLEDIPAGTLLEYRYRDDLGQWHPLAPLEDLEQVAGKTYVPRLNYVKQHQSPPYLQARVLLETTLEGLLCGYKGGKFAPRDRQEMFQGSLAQRILSTNIPQRLASLSIDEVMVPICASIADRAQLNPKFNYLTYNIAELDWQIGSADEFRRLVDAFHAQRLLLIPDMIFVHQVRNPYPGSLDSVTRSKEYGTDPEGLYIDPDPFCFRDYGTWMVRLQDPLVRRQAIEKIVALATRYGLQTIRIDYVDGLIKQFCQRSHNYAEDLVRELKAELQRATPKTIVLGEAFEEAGNPAVQELIDVFYMPTGFSILEELHKPLEKRDRPLFPDISRIVRELNNSSFSDRKEAIYAQLHDEIWEDEQITLGRPDVPWAYGANPAQLAKNRGEDLVRLGLLSRAQLLDYVRRTVRAVEAMTMFVAKLKYMYVPGVDSLALKGLDAPNYWRVGWDGILPGDMGAWVETGLSPGEIFDLHQQHRADMIRLRSIFRRYSPVEPDGLQPLVQPEVYHQDADSAFLAILRRNHVARDGTLLVIFNLGDRRFHDDTAYELPVPDDLAGDWEVLFDGDRGPGVAAAYPVATMLETNYGSYSGRAAALRLNIGPRSLLVLRYARA
ncbi:MAG: alpha amylase C-terminal domain-containing protein [Cyanobacteria bacterium J06641_5]